MNDDVLPHRSEIPILEETINTLYGPGPDPLISICGLTTITIVEKGVKPPYMTALERSPAINNIVIETTDKTLAGEHVIQATYVSDDYTYVTRTLT